MLISNSDSSSQQNLEFEYWTLLSEIVLNDDWMIDILKTVTELDLNDCWIGAGFIRNKVWDTLHGYSRTKFTDVDVIYYCKSNTSKETDLMIESTLRKHNPRVEWSVKNQARMHIRNNHKQYADCKDSISYWPETATSIAIKNTNNSKIDYISPYGMADLFNLVLRPSLKTTYKVFYNRVYEKEWMKKWPRLRIEVR